MEGRFFPTGARTAEDHECANRLADVLVAMHQQGKIQQVFDDIAARDWQKYLFMARAILDFGWKENQKRANDVLLIIRKELESKNFESTEAKDALRVLNNMAHMDADAAVPKAFTSFANKIGYHFTAGWESLGKTYIQFQAAARCDSDLVKLVDAEINRYQNDKKPAVLSS